MRVLVLRPEPAATRTAGALAARGHEAVLLPLSRAEHDGGTARAALARPHAAIAITSAEAVRLLGALDQDLALETTVFAVGAASAGAARAIGFTAVLSADGDGEALAGLIAAHYREKGAPAEPLLYLAGNPRAPGFEQQLAATGIAFRTVEAYRMAPLTPSRAEVEAALLQPVPGAALLYSRESARALFALRPFADMPERFGAMRFICMSRAVASAVPKRFAAGIAIAAAPDEESLLALL